MRLVVLITALGFGLASARPVLGAANSALVLTVEAGCEQVDAAELRRLLDVEARRRADVAGTRVDVRCRDDVVTLRVQLAGADRLPRSRELARADVSGTVGARVLSLAAVELLDDALLTPPEVTAPDLPSTPPAPESSPPSLTAFQPAVRLMGSGALQTIDLAPPLTGAGISVDYLWLAPLGLRLQFDLALGERNYPQGRARLRLTTLSAQVGYLAVRERWITRALLGYRFGAARIAGERAAGLDVSEGTVAGAYGGPTLSSGWGLRWGSFVVELAGEAGVVSFPVRGEVRGADSIALEGYWLGLSLNVGALL